VTRQRRITIRMPDGSLFEEGAAERPERLTSYAAPPLPLSDVVSVVVLRSPHGIETNQWLCAPCVARRKRARWEVLETRQAPPGTLLECDDCSGPGLECGSPF
jgi:hypothetical protein